MSQRFFEMPFVSVSPTNVTIFTRLLDSHTMDFYKSWNPVKNPIPEDNQHNGKISKKSHTRIYKRIFTYIYNVDKEILMSGKNREKIGFLTLTLPSSQIEERRKVRWGSLSETVKWYNSDQEIKSKCLNQLFVELSKHYGLKEKIWKAEKQKNGNIHFHILVDKFIPHADLKIRWNRIINKLGYVDRYRKQMEKLTEQQYIDMRLKSFSPARLQTDKKKLTDRFRKIYQEQKAEKWMNPNSVDIHSLYKNQKGKSIDNVVAYISKYMSKGDKENETSKEHNFETGFVTGRIWYCSQLISKACSVVVDYSDELGEAYTKAIEKLKDVHVIKDEYFQCACFNIVQAVRKGVKVFDKIFEDNLLLQRNIIYEKI